ncbi:MAG TPA: YbaB/EbfC family nucleoid-associated protein [Bacillota bacterium]|jgi:DNA-binding YbaB/EbfC family protein|nr:YbaB/EbfC family nucleoid-associated protein [Bacillota bacterium]HOL08610.1 YbaB/EbfC family nucleoid-associated protein [Bacillota bacterium]HPO98407.1 YbaB/EbfC family nucleoid-associated protein [Bacillota bacterium]
MIPNMQQAMKQFQKMQAEMARVQEELGNKTVSATAGGGVVKVEITGKLEIKQIEIDKEVVNNDEVEMLQDLIVAAVNEGIKKAQEMAADEMAKVTGNLKIPGMPGLF